jgi:membrane-bound lytic murein transglycosylase F
MLTEGLLTPEQIIELDTLRVATLYGSTSCFFLHGEQMGYDYELAQNLADYLGVNLKVHIAKNEDEMFRLLENNKVELVACKTVKTEKLSRKFRFVFPQSESYQVLVQKMGKHTLSNVIQLAGKEIYVKENSVFHRRLNHLNDETGGRIHVKTMPDTISSGNLIGMVVRDSIKYTLAFHDEAMLYKSYYPMLDCNLRIGFPQQKGWLVNKNSELAAVIEDWQSLRQTAQLESKLQTRYWNKNPYLSNIKIKIPRGAISPYDDYFKKYASEISWDWRMLAALAFTESGFDSTEVSVAGAVGLMQLMPATAATLGLDENTYFAPEKNIKAGVDYIKSLNGIFKTVQNKDERKKFVLASYNSGPAHILDAMALAEKYGKNPQLWSGNVEYFLLKKKEPEFYTDTVVKYGTFHGTETVGHVKRVQEIYEKYLKK